MDSMRMNSFKEMTDNREGFRNNQHVEHLIGRYPQLITCRKDIEDAIALLAETFRNKNRLFICGNGGSHCDSQHIAGELMKGFVKDRPVDPAVRERAEALFSGEGAYLANHLQRGLPAVALGSQTGFASAYINDVKPDLVYAQELFALASSGDVLIGISTSGNSANVYYAALTAKLLGMSVILLCGSRPGRIGSAADIQICVPAEETYKIQELHLPVYHAICIALEDYFYE